MTPTSAPASRPRRSVWFDPRLTIGIVLVLASITGVLAVVASVDNSATVYAARDDLSVGDRIMADDLVEQSVRLGGAADSYIGAGAIPSDGLVITRTVAAGELVPVSAVGDTAGDRLAPVVIPLSSGLPRAATAGATVDVWAAREGDSGAYGAPTVLVPSALVARVVETDGIMAGNQAVSVELLVPRSRTARILEAVANADALSLVPVGLPANLVRG